MFQGNSALSLDAKGRMTIPARYRDALLTDSHGKITITRNLDGGLLIYPRFEWEAKRKNIMDLPSSQRGLQRLLLGNAQDVELDGSGRVLIAPELRDVAGIVKDVVLVGMGQRFELWAADKFAAQQEEDLASIDLSKLDDFSL
ncbi:division/cell wall cluster transcriptional repressor MraZ [Pelistega sp. NLN82]|uniref:Transcriptional regulator MraZ n=1 Tax=Pelistega ratti TaxID=2652177 RepID=A0A6L9Y5N1_9BURK|nr:division/cell wall cluster transcriptional repressor MraZ [Pelistega ratti]NEN75653.1 division/cell wall cluster transcriptional repressor MraZ [Pelistega ratti]